MSRCVARTCASVAYSWNSRRKAREKRSDLFVIKKRTHSGSTPRLLRASAMAGRTWLLFRPIHVDDVYYVVRRLGENERERKWGKEKKTHFGSVPRPCPEVHSISR